MKARKLSEGASFDPQQLKTIGKAFDDAGKRFAPSVSPHPGSVETARLRLGQCDLEFGQKRSPGRGEPDRGGREDHACEPAQTLTVEASGSAFALSSSPRLLADR